MLRLAEFLDSRHRQFARLSALRTGHLYPPGDTTSNHYSKRLSRTQGHITSGRNKFIIIWYDIWYNIIWTRKRRRFAYKVSWANSVCTFNFPGTWKKSPLLDFSDGKPRSSLHNTASFLRRHIIHIQNFMVSSRCSLQDLTRFHQPYLDSLFFLILCSVFQFSNSARTLPQAVMLLNRKWVVISSDVGRNTY